MFIVFLLLSILLPLYASLDGKTCATMEAICSDDGLEFKVLGGSDTAPVGNNYDCLRQVYEPTWYYLKISSDTAIGSTLSMALSAPQDIDFIVYGPFNSLDEAKTNCGSLGTGSGTFNVVEDCSYSGDAIETPEIASVRPNEVYVMLVSNYKRVEQTIKLSLDSSSVASTDCSIVSAANECILGTNYFFNGNQAAATGDPHFKMWNGDQHDFQGVGSIDDQYYYITRDSESSRKDLPFNVLGKHYYYEEGKEQMRSVEYITIELFDSNDDYYLIFLQSNILKYTHNAVPYTTSTLYKNINPALLSTFIPGQAQQIGQLFNAKVTSKTGYEMHFELQIGGIGGIGGCELKLHMHNIGIPKPSLNHRSVQNLYIEPPNCYQCSITGLFGDFQKSKIPGEAAKMQICNGKIYYMDIKSGWQNNHATAYDVGGLSYKKSLCPRGPGPNTRRRLLQGSVDYTPRVPANFIYQDLCPIDSAIAQLTISECATIRRSYDATLCAPQTMKHLCDELQENCEYDACVLANNDMNKVKSSAGNVFAFQLGFLQRIPNIIELNNAMNIQYKLECPQGTTQVGPLNSDIGGCGLEACDHRYLQNTIVECMDHCLENDQCKSFTFAPHGGDKAIVQENVCTIYNTNAPTWLWGPNQIMCAIN